MKNASESIGIYTSNDLDSRATQSTYLDGFDINGCGNPQELGNLCKICKIKESKLINLPSSKNSEKSKTTQENKRRRRRRKMKAEAVYIGYELSPRPDPWHLPGYFAGRREICLPIA